MLNLFKTPVVCFGVSLFLGLGCAPGFELLKPVPLPIAMADSVEYRNLDTLVVSGDRSETSLPHDIPAEFGIYHESFERTFDLLHTKLELSFDWTNEKVIGLAELTLSPLFYPQHSLTLDAKGFEIHSVTLDGNDLEHTYDGVFLKILLGRKYSREEEVVINIDYTAFPKAQNGSSAIASDQGLFFINSDSSDAKKPQQIWTQGETEFNSRWFPTIDKPNERCTQEMLLTVDDRFKTLSNGILVSSTSNNDGTRTDNWIMDQPHAPYLFMIAVGEFAVVKDTWMGKEVSYYIEPEYEDDARDIFAHTTEMLTFFSELVGVPYPWQKYAQVVVRDYVSGAMENTTAVIYGDFVQRHKRELIDNGNDRIVAHELFHHWFGDYVTCESWSNLTLNESFANYSEYLWFDHKYGKDYADHHRASEMQGYLYQANQNIHPLIEFAYDDKEDMFDAHSYNKGGLVLHMLRDEVGDEAFFAALNLYLRRHAHQAVEVHDLRLAFEDVTGKDLNWFFNQWFLEAGHPILNVDHKHNAEDGTVSVSVDQLQGAESTLFKLNTQVGLYDKSGAVEYHDVTIDSKHEELIIETSMVPVVVVLDPHRTQLAVINADYNVEQAAILYHPEANLALRTEAIGRLAQSGERMDLTLLALNDPFWGVRAAALGSVDWSNHIDQLQIVADLASSDKNSSVRAEAIAVLGEFGDDRHVDAVSKGINTTDAYPVVASSIVALNKIAPSSAIEKLVVLQDENQSDIVAALSTIYAESEDTTQLEYFDKHLMSVSGLPAIAFYESLEALLKMTKSTTKMLWMEKFAVVGKTATPYTKIAATRSMISLLKSAESTGNILDEEQTNKLRAMVQSVIDNESNPQILSLYQSFMGS